MTAIIEVHNLVKRFGEHTAVNGISFEVEQGEVFGLLGPNGAGKSTTIKMLITLLSPTSGNARVAGFDIMHDTANVRRSIGYVPQALSADATLTGFENLLIFAKLYDLPRKIQAKRVHEVLDFVGLSEASNQLVQHYSGGMIRLLVLRSQTDMTIFVTTHSMEEADSLCSRVGIMHHGDIVALDTPDNLKATVGGPETTLNDVFVHYAGDTLESGGSYRETSRARRTARRLG